MADYETERAVVERFLAIFGVTKPRLGNPNAGLRNDSGADVVWTVDGCDSGFQVTECHSDKGAAANRKGSHHPEEAPRRDVTRWRTAQPRFCQFCRLPAAPHDWDASLSLTRRSRTRPRTRFPGFHQVINLSAGLGDHGAVVVDALRGQHVGAGAVSAWPAAGLRSSGSKAGKAATRSCLSCHRFLCLPCLLAPSAPPVVPPAHLLRAPGEATARGRGPRPTGGRPPTRPDARPP
jgi:hypothetical protein